MRTYISLLIFLFALVFICSWKNDSVKKDMLVVQVRMTGSPMLPDHLYRVYYAGEYKLYESQYGFQTSDGLIDTTGSITKSNFKNYIGTKFLVFHKDSSYGYSFDSSQFVSKVPVRIQVDSALKIIRIQTGAGFDSLLFRTPDSTAWNEDKSERTDIYRYAETKTLPAFTQSLSYTNRMNHVDESFSAAHDRARKMKLFRMKLEIEKFYDAAQDVHWPAYTVNDEMSIVPVPLNAWSKFLDDYKKLCDTGKATRQ
jgi:hypothetical protein